MPKRQVLAIAAAALAVVAVGSAASASALTPNASGRASAQVSQHATVRTLGPGARGAGDPPGPGCGFTKAVPFDNFKGLPPFTAKKAARAYLAVMHTTQGTIVVQMNTAAAPCTTYSFRFLAQNGFYNGTHCHRMTVKVIFVLQCGDPTGTGSGGPGYRFNDENLSGATYPTGTVAMANAGPNTNGSQFFFCWKPNPLPPLYTPFGKVISGMSVLRKIAAAGDDSQNGPGDGYPHLLVQFTKIQIIFASR